MRTGKLRERVKVVSYALAPDGAGGTTMTATQELETWASVTTMKGLRAMQYGQIIQATWYDVHLRYREDVVITKDVILAQGVRELVIHSVVEDTKNRKLTITAYKKL